MKHNQLRRQLFRHFSGVAALRLLSIPFSLLTSIILARWLGMEGFGQYSFCMSVVTLVAIPVCGGVSPLLTREVAGYVLQNQWGLYRGMVRRAFVHVAIGSAIFISIVLFLDRIFATTLSEDKWRYLPIAILILPFLGLTAVRAGTLKGLGHPMRSQVPELLIQPLSMITILLILFAFDRLDTTTAIASRIVSAVMVLAVGTAILKHATPKAKLKAWSEIRRREWFVQLTPFAIMALIVSMNAQLSATLLGLMHSNEAVAAIRVAERGAQFVMLALTIINAVISPHIVRAHREKNAHLMQSLSTESARAALFMALPIALSLVFFGKPILEALFGPEYREAAYLPLAVIVLAHLINVAFGSVGHLLSMSGYAKDTLKGQSLALLVNAGLCWWLIPELGALGAAISFSISIIVLNVFLAHRVVRRLGIRPGPI